MARHKLNHFPLEAPAEVVDGQDWQPEFLGNGFGPVDFGAKAGQEAFEGAVSAQEEQKLADEGVEFALVFVLEADLVRGGLGCGDGFGDADGFAVIGFVGGQVGFVGEDSVFAPMGEAVDDALDFALQGELQLLGGRILRGEFGGDGWVGCPSLRLGCQGIGLAA